MKSIHILEQKKIETFFFDLDDVCGVGFLDNYLNYNLQFENLHYLEVLELITNLNEIDYQI